MHLRSALKSLLRCHPGAPTRPPSIKPPSGVGHFEVILPGGSAMACSAAEQAIAETP